MPEVLEIEQIDIETTAETIKPKWDSWTIAIPPEIIEAQGFTEGSLVHLNCRDGAIESRIIVPSAELKEISKRILEERREVFEELKRFGD